MPSSDPLLELARSVARAPVDVVRDRSPSERSCPLRSFARAATVRVQVLADLETLLAARRSRLRVASAILHGA